LKIVALSRLQNEDRNRAPAGSKRTLRLLLDPAQYRVDALEAKKAADATGDKGISL
jgi:hypothetical protein